MKTTKKLLSLLVLGLMVTGCDVEALPNDYENEYGAIKMEDLYDTIRNGQGEAAIYNQFISKIAEEEINAAKRGDELVERVQEKIDDLIEDQYTDFDYSLYGKDGFETPNIDKMNAYYKSQGYQISGENAWDAKAVLKDKTSTNTYVSKTLKNDVLTSMLNEQFIYDKKAKTLYATKQLRQIEYIYIDVDKENEDATVNFVNELNKELMSTNAASHDLEAKADEWKEIRKATILENAKKAGDPEKDEDGKYYNEFTSCANSSVRECANEKMHAVDEIEFYHEPEIYTKADSPLIASLTDVVFSSTIDYKDTDKVHEVTVTKDGGVQETYYYVKAQSNIELGSNSLINIDSSTGNYYFVRFTKVDTKDENNDGTPDCYANLDLKYDSQKPEYAIAQALATESSNYSNCIIYYLEKYNFEIHDDKFFEYIFDTYGYPEED